MNGYSNGKPRKHWAWSLAGAMLAMVVPSLMFAWVIEGMA